MKKTIILLLLLIVTISGYSQFSKTHYIPPITASTFVGSTTIDVDQYIYISTPSTKPVTVTITPLGGTPVTNTVDNGNPWVYMISAPTIPDPNSTPAKPKPDKEAKDGQNTQLFVPSYLLGSVLKDRGYLIEAGDFVYANLRVSSKVSSGSSSQAGGLVAKGISAYGTEFRIGGMENRGVMDSKNGEALMNFASFVATEDNTTVTITLPKAPLGTYMLPKILNGNYAYSYPFPNQDFHYPPAGAPAAISYTTPTYKNHIYNGPITVTLNKNESYVIAMENSSGTTFESNYMLGGLIKSDRNIVVNCGSVAGNSQIKGEGLPNSAPYNDKGKDFGFDQIVGADKAGREFVFVGGSGMAAATKAYDLERAIIVANVNGTQIFKNGNATPVATINAGDYYVFNGNDYVSGNLYVKTSENVFAYQGIAGIGSSGKADAGNQNMVFVPPLNCATPSAVNNIPLIDEIGLLAPPSTNGKVIYSNTVVNIVTQKFLTDGVTANKVYVNGIELTPTTPGLIQRTNVTGKTDIPFVAYSYKTTGGKMAVSASAQVYVSFYGSNDNAAFGSYFSGFDIKPSITAPLGASNSICIDGTTALSVTSAVATDEFQWNFNGVVIAGATGNSYIPKSIANGGKGPGYYTVTKKSACINVDSESLPIAVSECPANDDTDPVFNNIDADSDNDGITNANESYGDLPVSLANPAAGTITAGGGAYTNSYTGVTTPAGSGPNSFTGDPSGNGAFTSSLAAGNTNAMTYNLNFSKPASIGIQYNAAGATVASQSNASFEIKTGLTSTITILNPTNQLLIDTDNDGIFESGVTEFSSFDVKFKLNPTVLLPTPGTPPALDFKIQTYLATSVSFTHHNISTSATNTASFSIIALSVPKDSDGDAKNDQVDTDSDGDGILDLEEGQIGNKTITTPLTDTNKNGIADNFEPVVPPVDTDLDGVPDFIDLDSDNDGILDSLEGVVDSSTPTNAIKNYREIDSDGDTCNDVIEAGFTDPDADGVVGTSPVTVDPKTGKVTSITYPTSVSNYYTINKAPVITTQPSAISDCATKTATCTIAATNVGTYKWQVSTNGGGTLGTWTDIVNSVATPTSPGYAGSTTATLSITNAVNGYFYRVDLSSAESACVPLQSAEVEVKMTGVPVANDVTMEQCDTDLDGMATFDLTSKNTLISTGTGETFSYYATQPLAIAGTPGTEIPNPTTYSNATAHAMDVYARVQNSAGCYDLAKIALTVGVQIPAGYVFPTPPAPVCDDAVSGTNTDGISAFNLTATKAAFDALFPAATPTMAYTVTFYPTQADANAQTAPITNLSAYRNTIANTQPIWVRVTNSNAAFSTCAAPVSTYFSLNVEALPTTTPVTKYENCDTDGTADLKFSFNTSTLETTLLGTPATGKTVVYLDANNAPLKDANGIAITSPFPNTFFTTTQQIKAVVSNTTAQKCSAAPVLIDFKVNPAPVVNDVIITVCDTDLDGFASFNLTSKNSSISANAANETFTYYTSQPDALAGGTTGLIPSPLAYINTTIYGMDVWARVVSANNCSSVAKVTLNVVVAFPTGYATSQQPAPVCDDNILGTDTDGITEFDLTVAKADIESNITVPGYTFTYYGTQADFNAKTNAITNFANYRNKSKTDLDIWVRVTNTLNPTCESFGKYIQLNVEALPVAKATKELYKECDDNTDGQFAFVNTVDQDVRKGRTDVTVNYYDNNDPTNTLLFSSFPTTYTTGNITVRAEVINNTAQLCSDETLIVFQVDVKPVTVDPIINPLVFTECDDAKDPMNQDGKTTFNTSSIESTILGVQTDPTVMIVSYFAQDGTALPSPFPAYFITKTQTVTYEVENINNLNNVGCTASGTIQFTVTPLPLADLNADGDDNEVICINDPSLTFDLTAGVPAGTNTTGYTYQWSKDGVVLTGEISDTLQDVNTEGIYTVAISNGSCPVIRTIKVGASEKSSEPILIVTDLTEDNTITVNVTGRGNYGYSLDDEIGYYQDSNVFTNVSPGTHTIWVRDRNGCGTVNQVTAVIGVPKFFTPNNDGYNDTWNIKGVDNMGYTIFIYDRYGKLLKELIPESTQGWDGNFNLAPMPGSDYWYSLKLENGREAKGHFSLKR